jgi:dTMP kinase
MNAPDKRGRFITMEGPDGAGKTTNFDYVQSLLEEAGLDVVRTREPGGTRLGEKVREVLLQEQPVAIGADAETLMIFAARAQHIEEVIEPNLAKGRWVLCDRFTDATYAYQGHARALGAARVAVLEDWVQGPLRPDLTLLLDIPVALAAKRVGARGTLDRFEHEGHEFKQAVRAGYLELARRDPERIQLIDASQELAAVQAELAQVIGKLLTRLQTQIGC